MRATHCLAAAIVWTSLAALAAGQPPDGPLVRLTSDGLFKQRPAWSPDGKWLSFARHEGATIFVYVRAADGASERRLTTRTDPEFDAVWSPDGSRLSLAIDNASPNQGDIDVYTVAAEGGDLKPFAATGKKLSHEEWPAWSPDGKRIAFTTTRDDNQEVYVALADGSEPKRLTSDPAIDAHPCWSPDGTYLVFATSRWGDLELARIEADGSGLVRLTQSPGLDDYPAWSPDGKSIAFARNRDGNFEIYSIDADGRGARNRTQHPAIDNFPAWTPDGRLTFVSNRDGGFDIYAVAPSGAGSPAEDRADRR